MSRGRAIGMQRRGRHAKVETAMMPTRYTAPKRIRTEGCTTRIACGTSRIWGASGRAWHGMEIDGALCVDPLRRGCAVRDSEWVRHQTTPAGSACGEDPEPGCVQCRSPRRASGVRVSGMGCSTTGKDACGDGEAPLCARRRRSSDTCMGLEGRTRNAHAARARSMEIDGVGRAVIRMTRATPQARGPRKTNGSAIGAQRRDLRAARTQRASGLRCDNTGRGRVRTQLRHEERPSG
ncbi:hypothetical protein B0H10DRAFT_130729 [Mycena sp. CBHHK59/15]|nr:hypothetical protein B0H10DRAFT_130729 [Mycena sp. CBHHK59/15]